MPSLKLTLTAAALVAAAASGANAAFSSLIAFGDDMSDNHLAYMMTGSYWAPYYEGRFSNGPVAVEYMASALGISLDWTGDRAVGGATTGWRDDPDGPGPLVGRPNYFSATHYQYPHLPNMQDELSSYLRDVGGHADPAALYVVWGGLNDIRLARWEGRLTTSTQITAVIDEAVGNLASMTGSLVAAGATHIFVPGMLDLGIAPEFGHASDTAVSVAFNSALQSSLQATLPAGTWQYHDVFGEFHAIVSNPAAYGFTNVSRWCLPPSGLNICGATTDVQNHYLWFDGIHPTTSGQQILGNAFAAAVPEPEIYALMLAGLGSLLLRRRVMAARGRGCRVAAQRGDVLHSANESP